MFCNYLTASDVRICLKSHFYHKKCKITWFHVSLLENAGINLDVLYWREEEAWKKENLSQNLPILTTEKVRAAHGNYLLTMELFYIGYRIKDSHNNWSKPQGLVLYVASPFSFYIGVNVNNMMYNLWSTMIDTNTLRTVHVIHNSENASYGIHVHCSIEFHCSWLYVTSSLRQELHFQNKYLKAFMQP